MRELKQFLRTYRGFLFFGGMVVVSLLVLFLGLIPLMQKDVEEYGKLIALSEEVEVLKTKSQLLQSLDEETLRRQFLLAISAIPTDKSVATVITTVEAIASLNGATVTNVRLDSPGTIATSAAGQRIQATESRKRVGVLPITVSMMGSLDQIKQVLAQLITVRRMVEIGKFDMSFIDAQIASLDVSLEAIYAPVLSQLGDVAQPLESFTPEEEAILAKVSNMKDLSSTFVLPKAQVNLDRADPFAP